MRAHITMRCTQYTWRLKYAAAAARYKTRQQNQKVGAFECSLSANDATHMQSAATYFIGDVWSFDPSARFSRA